MKNKVCNNISDIKKKINELAVTLVTLNSETQYAQIATIQEQIRALFVNAGFEYKHTDKHGNDWYDFSILDNLCAPFEPVFKALEENIRKSKKKGKEGKWNFNPEEGNFIITIIKKAKFKVGRKADMLKGYIQTEEDIDSDGTSKGTVKDYGDSANHIEEVDRNLYYKQRVEYIANMIICQNWIEKGKENKQHFEGFFTHDRVTEERTTGGAYITEEYSNVIFPAMSIKLLEYLMHGCFSHMRDLVINKVRDGINLKQCIKNVGDCFEMDSPKYFHGKYKQWLVSIDSGS